MPIITNAIEMLPELQHEGVYDDSFEALITSCSHQA
jgi:hypothetical protein